MLWLRREQFIPPHHQVRARTGVTGQGRNERGRSGGGEHGAGPGGLEQRNTSSPDPPFSPCCGLGAANFLTAVPQSSALHSYPQLCCVEWGPSRGHHAGGCRGLGWDMIPSMADSCQVPRGLSTVNFPSTVPTGGCHFSLPSFPSWVPLAPKLLGLGPAGSFWCTGEHLIRQS